MIELIPETAKHGRDIIFHCLRDFEYDRSLEKIIFPNSINRNQMNTIRENISRFNLFDKEKNIKENNFSEKKKRRPIPSTKTLNGKKYEYQIKKENTDGYRLMIKSLFDLGLVKWNLTPRSKNILEAMFYPDFMRKLCFNEESFEHCEKDFEQMLRLFFQSNYFDGNYMSARDEEVLTWGLEMEEYLKDGLSPMDISYRFMAKAISPHDMSVESKEEFMKRNTELAECIKTKEGYEDVSEYFYNDILEGCGVNLENYYSYFLDVEFIADILFNLGGYFLLEIFLDRYFTKNSTFDKIDLDTILKISEKESKNYDPSKPYIPKTISQEEKNRIIEQNEPDKEILEMAKKIRKIKEKYQEENNHLNFLFRI